MKTSSCIGCAVFACLPASMALAQNCAGTTAGRVPIMDLGPAMYLEQFPGGLYREGSNQMPQAHLGAGLARAAAIQPLNAQGQPDPAGAIIMISVGMSNTTQEFCNGGAGGNCSPETFMGQAAVHPHVNHSTLKILDGARGGQAASSWIDPNHPNYNRIRDQILAPRGLSELQVQVAWVKQANQGPSSGLPDLNADAYVLVQHLGDIARAIRVRYPNIQQVYFSSRIYAGYATTALNPEPYAYESGFSVKWLVESQVRQQAGVQTPHPFSLAGNLLYDGPSAAAPWLAWGAYLWGDGLTPRSDGFIWECADYTNDGTHPAYGARLKVGTQLLDFFLTSPTTVPWFRADGGNCYPDCDASGSLNIDDFTCFINAYAAALGLPPQQQIGHYANCDGSTAIPVLNVEDFTCFIDAFAAGCR